MEYSHPDKEAVGKLILLFGQSWPGILRICIENIFFDRTIILTQGGNIVPKEMYIFLAAVIGALAAYITTRITGSNQVKIAEIGAQKDIRLQVLGDNYLDWFATTILTG